MERSSLLQRAALPLILPTYDGSGQAVHPDVIRVNGRFFASEFAMVVEPYPDGNDALENPSLLCSDDGQKWRVPPGVVNPVVDPPQHIGAWNSDADLIETPDRRLLMFYRFNSGQGETTCYRMSSDDGICWSPPNPLFTVSRSGKFASPALVYTNQRYHMYYVDTVDQTINVSISRDSTHWQPDRALFYFESAWHIDATLADDWIYLLLNDRHSLYLFRGRDEDEWYILKRTGWSRIGSKGYQCHDYKDLPIMSPSNRGWDGGIIYRSSCLIEDGHISLWYGARTEANVWNVGFSSGRIPK